MADQRILTLINRLRERTDQGKVSWREADRGDAFLASFSNNSVSVSQRESRQGSGAEYVIRILNSWGDTIEEVGDEDFQNQEVYETMKNLFDKARRIALGLDEALDSILKELDESDDMPF